MGPKRVNNWAIAGLLDADAAAADDNDEDGDHLNE
jgi:hypothetical protein